MSAFILEASLKYNEVHGSNRLQLMNDIADKFSDFKYQLEKIGTNVNQIAHVLNVMNRQRNISLFKDMLEQIAEYNKTIKRMRIIEEKLFKQMIK